MHPITLKKAALIASDGASLPARWWMPKNSPKAVIIALHGMNDYSRAFTLLGEYMQQHEVAVLAYDQRGFGASPRPGIWPGQDNLVSDLKDAVLAIRQDYPQTPVYVLGLSMGGAVAITASASKDFPPVDGIMLAAPAVWGGNAMNPFYRASLWALAHIMPGKILTGQNLHILATDNIELLKQMWRDKYVIKGTRTDSIFGLVHLMDNAHAGLRELHTPFLLLYGKQDQVIPPEAVAGALGELPASAVLAYYPNGYHLLVSDHAREVVFNDMLAWMDNPAAALPSGLDAEGKKWFGGMQVKNSSGRPGGAGVRILK